MLTTCLFALHLVGPHPADPPALRGIASWYSVAECGPATASGTPLRDDALTCAMRRVPLGSTVRVTRRDTGAAVVVTVTDVGPFVAGRIVDLSRGAARRMGMLDAGVAPVVVEVTR